MLVLVAGLNTNLAPVMKDWSKAVEVTAVHAQCGYENAFYFPAEKLVLMCVELSHDPALERFVFRHELAHAFMWQHGIPSTERGADELAVLTSPASDIEAAARWFERVDGYVGNGGHPQPHDRAAALRCLSSGMHAPTLATPVCRMYYASVYDNWQKLFKLGK